ncbi:sulfatase-like hydrolase/transferase [Halomicrobium sp. IBSBa]|uniref:sulfatase n=1 Tax=Halomicrobium sp. IBSBa TaxID=2778916 RepID=UPI001ABF868C|nr:sulfatase [Halomicrobium sp. IBSBa]MBO4248903.1 sulfatase-like hydrolase/transferase [Halomicrobium sp. IBSBa]
MGTNVLYITVDSLRADSVGFLDEEVATTPNLDELADSGVSFDTAVANGIPTYYSFKSLLGGVHSLSHSQSIGLPETATSIAEVFADAGYQTAGINASNPWLTPSYGYDRGFETYEDFLEADAGGGSSLGRQAKRVAKRAVSFSDLLTDRLGLCGRVASALLGSQPLEPAENVSEVAVSWLEGKDDDRPFFLWIHFMDPHYPWIPRQEFLEESRISTYEIGRLWHTVAHEYKKTNISFDGETIRTIRALYDAEVRRMDDAIGAIIDALEAAGDREETLIAVAGDHGTELYDHGAFSHGPTKLYDEVLCVPLLFSGPSIENQSRELAGLVDVPKTIVERIDSVETPTTFEGIDLFETKRECVSSEVVFDIDPALGQNEDNSLLQSQVEPPWKLIRNRETGTVRLFDRNSDPDERTDLADDRSEVVERMESGLDEHRATVERRTRTVVERCRVRERIRDLKADDLI